MILPRLFARLLVGRSIDEELRPQRPPIRFELEKGAVHISQGTFVVGDEQPAASPAPVLEPVDPSIGQQLADELKATIGRRSS